MKKHRTGERFLRHIALTRAKPLPRRPEPPRATLTSLPVPEPGNVIVNDRERAK